MSSNYIVEILPRSGESRRHTVRLLKGEAEIYTGGLHFFLGELLGEGQSASLELESIRDELRELRVSLTSSEMKEVGQSLFRFFPSSISTAIEEERTRPVHLMIVNSAPGLEDLPWELLCTLNGEFLALRPNFSISRYVPRAVASVIPAVQLPVQMLLVLPNPKEERLMKTGLEVDAILGSIDRSWLETSFVEEPTLEALVHSLQDKRPTIVHYIGHGGISGAEGNLIFEQLDLGRTRWLGPDELAAILPTSVRLLCLSTCFTAENYQIEAFNRLGQTRGYDLPTMVVNQFPLSESSVRTFWSAFYETLYRGGMIEAAVSGGRRAVHQSSSQMLDWASFVLHLRNCYSQIFSIAPSIAPDEMVETVRGIEDQLAITTGLVNDLQSQVLAFGKSAPPDLLVVLEREDKRRRAQLTKLEGLKRSLGWTKTASAGG